MPVVLLLGPPGSGKGTQASFLKKYKPNFVHLATGDLIRQEIANKTSLGKKLKQYFNKGLLVPDNLVNDILRNTIENAFYRGSNSFILDGYPRTIEQLNELERILQDYDLKIDFVFYFKVDEAIVVERLSGRRVCPKCNEIYHIKNKPPKTPDKCDKCKKELIQREDDKEEIIRKRISEYIQKTTPLLKHFEDKNVLHQIEASDKPENIFENIKSIIFGVSI
jgi:adenylate kinase